ncbi:MAG: DUF488 family protein [Candidatus Tectomicrobia bacterium]|nr:DUF488 family protein [Candidatus Tectomicrobia bacterium]
MHRPTIFTIGHSNRTAESFVASLRAHQVLLLVDVRSVPRSRFASFNRRALEALLDSEAIGYAYVGDLLGGRGEQEYPAHLETAAFAQGLAELEALAGRLPTCFMCAERDPAQCHRRFLADRLAARGWRVLHILDGSRSTPHAMNLPLFETQAARPAAATTRLFVYGSLGDAALRRQLLGRAPPAVPARLSGFQRRLLPGFAYPFLVPTSPSACAEEAAVVDGEVLFGLRAGELRRLDVYEGVAEGLYERRLAVASVAGEDEGTAARRRLLEVYVYVAGSALLNR